MSEIKTREEYNALINEADVVHQQAVREVAECRIEAVRRDRDLDTALINFRAGYPVMSPAQVHQHRLGQQQKLLQEHVDAGGSARGFLGEKKPEAASALDANRIYSKGGSVELGVGLNRRGGFDVSKKGQTIPSKRPGE